MGIFNSMLNAGRTAWSWGEFAETSNWGWVNDLMTTLSTVLWVCLALVGAAGGIYAVYVGIKMARAESSEQREENKKRLINIIVSIVAVIVLILFFNTFLPAILTAFGIGMPTDDYTPAPDSGSSSIATIVNTAKVLLHI